MDDLSNDYSLTIGVGEPVSSINLLAQSYENALNAIKLRIFSGKNKVLTYSGKKAKNIGNLIFVREEKRIINSIDLFDLKGFEQQTGELFEKSIVKFNHNSLQTFELAYYVADLIITLMNRKDIINNSELVDRKMIYERINACSSIQEIINYLVVFFKN
jgi:hypothetical protein